jgi:hypothetical protein
MPEFTLYGKRRADFQMPEAENLDLPLGKWHGQQGSNLRPAVLETAALPTELCPYTGAAISQSE